MTSKRKWVQRTILNWRFWAVLPVTVVILPAALVSLVIPLGSPSWYGRIVKWSQYRYPYNTGIKLPHDSSEQSESLLERYRDKAPGWANYITADAHGYIKAFEFAPKETPGGLYYSVGRELVLSKPGYTPEVLHL